MIIKKSISICLAVLIIICTYQLSAKGIFQESDSTSQDKVYYAIEINDVVCGYFEASETSVLKNGKELIQADINIFTMLSLFGSKFNQELKISALIEPESRKYKDVKILIDQGSTKFNIEYSIDKDTAYYYSSIYDKKKKIKLNPETITGSDEMFLIVKKDFLDKKVFETNYEILEMIEGEIQNSTFKKLGEENIELSGVNYNTILIEQTNNKTNIKTKYWLTEGYDYFIKFEVQNRKVYLTDKSVIDKIKVSNMDANFFTKSNLSISDFQSISYMKLKGRIEPTGVQISPQILNVTGQKFDGTVTGNIIEGIFEINHKKYDGKNAPKFPPDFVNEKEIKKYLQPDPFIESNDPLLVNKAKEITTGSKNSWEAAVKLSKWVAENISYAIPGGGTAKKTYDIKAGECGAHSMLLAAFCRAVGIPARVVFGALYIPSYGGGFGQHAWNEIYMGEDGWIPVDATTHEIDYVDSGHLRISEIITISAISFSGKSLEIIDYKMSNKNETISSVELKMFEPYLGKYTNIESLRKYTVLVNENNLSVDIPGQVVIPFNLPDEKGKWICKIAPHLSISFSKDQNDKINEMIMSQTFSLPKKSSEENINENISIKLVPYLGKYFFAAINSDLTVLAQEGSLSVYDPVNKTTIKFKPLENEDGWIDEFNKNKIIFELDSEDNVTGIKLETTEKFKKGETASSIIEKIINEGDLQRGISKYAELKNINDSEIIFSEQALNNLGFKYLSLGKTEEALEIFLLNVNEYPDSFNVYDSLGEAYMRCNRNEEAINNYKKSLELNPKNKHAISKLEELGIKQ